MPALLAAASIAATMLPYDLRCEALTEPLAIQTAQPQLSWKLQAVESSARNLHQTAYRILAATDPKFLSTRRADLWDSGRVDSTDTTGILYSGRALGSRTRCYWKVRIWDQNGRASDWSATASFGTGLMKQSDWKGSWIHGPKPSQQEDILDGASWIWSEGSIRGNMAAGTHRFRRSVTIGSVRAARMLVTADNTFVLTLNGHEICRTTDPERWSSVQSIDIRPFLTVGRNDFEIEATNVAPSPAGVIAAIELIDGDGRRSVVKSDSSWTTERGTAIMLGPNGIQPWGKVRANQFLVSPALYFRKAVKISKSVRRATAFVTALGIVDFTIDGARVSDDLFTPGWPDYRKRVYYRAFDVTAKCAKGSHEFGAVLGQGWYSGYVAWAAQREHYGDTPMFRAQVELEFDDGTRATYATGSDWLVASGPILDEHFLHGEKFDARIEPHNWRPSVAGRDAVPIEAFPGDPVRAYQTLKPVKIWKHGDGKYLADFGQNLTGFVRLKLSESAGTKITIRHGERLDSKGNLYVENLRLAQAIDSYICKGKADEWNPRFTFHGFQYIEISGLKRMPKDGEFSAVAISSATPESGTLKTSDPMLGKLLRNAWWTQKMNFVDIPTDCPQRDERLGWTGDAQAYIRTATYFSDVQAFFNKWLVALDDSQGQDGNYPKVAPEISHLDDGGPAWADAGVICPMTAYDVYGDRVLLARHYPNMRRFVEFCRKRSKPDLLPPASFHCYGDWLSINADTPSDVIATAYFAGSVELVARAAHELGKRADEEELRALHNQIRHAFQEAYVGADGKVEGDTQCAFVLALAFDLLDEPQTRLAAQRLVADIEKRGWHLSTGFVGTRDLMHVLSKIGRNDVALRLLHNTTFPSWGFTIANGATSIWERWDGWTPEHGFQDPGMNSFAHYAYGAVAGWMFKALGGISELEPGYRRILVAPILDPKLSRVECSYDSVRGPISMKLHVSKGKVSMTVRIPPNTSAEVRVPRIDGSFKRVEIGSGTWNFSAS